MASEIEQFLNKILSSRYGKDVRQAIHDGIKQCYSDVTNPDLNVDAFETAVQNKIDSGALALMTIPDGSITKEKLDQDTNETIEKNTNDITDLKSAFNGVQFTDQDIATYLDDTSYLIGQLFDLEDCSKGKYYNQNGELTGKDSSSDTGPGMSPYIHVIPGRKVKIGTSAIVTFWTKDKEFISGDVGTEEDIEVPGNARYLRISVSNRIDIICLDTLSTNTSLQHYQSYMDAYFNEVYQYDEKIRARMLPNDQEKLETVINDTETNSAGIENIEGMIEPDFDIIRFPMTSYSYPLNPIISEAGWTDGIQIDNRNNGVEIENENYSVSGYVRIPKGLKFIRGKNIRIAYYDKHKTFIKMQYNNYPTNYGVYEIAPDNAYYVRFMIVSQEYKEGFELSTDTNGIGNMANEECVSYRNIFPTLRVNTNQIINNPMEGFLQKNTQLINWDDEAYWLKDNHVGCIIPYTEDVIYAPNPFSNQEGELRIYILDSEYNIIGTPVKLSGTSLKCVMSFSGGIMTYKQYKNAKEYELYENTPVREYSSSFANTDNITPSYIWFYYLTMPDRIKCGVTQNFVSDEYVPYGVDVEAIRDDIGIVPQIIKKFETNADEATKPNNDNEIIRLINGNASRKANEARNAIRVAVLNLTVAYGSVNWKRAREALANEGIDICGYNEVGMPNGEISGNYDGKIFKDYMSTWALPYHTSAENLPGKPDDGTLYGANMIGSRWEIKLEEFLSNGTSHAVIEISGFKKQVETTVESKSIQISFYSAHLSASSGEDRLKVAKEIIAKMNEDDVAIKICVMDANDNLGEHDVHRLFIKAGYLPAIPIQVVDQIFYDPKYLSVVNYKSYLPGRYTYENRQGKIEAISDHGLFLADLKIDIDSLFGVCWTDEKITEIQESELDL